jgi:hypothetical protein
MAFVRAKTILAVAGIMVWKGVPDHLRSANGPELVDKAPLMSGGYLSQDALTDLAALTQLRVWRSGKQNTLPTSPTLDVDNLYKAHFATLTRHWHKRVGRPIPATCMFLAGNTALYDQTMTERTTTLEPYMSETSKTIGVRKIEEGT